MIRPLVCVTLCINSELTAPDFWTRYFGVEPDYSGRKGEPITTTLGRLASGDGRINSWVVASETAVESGSLDNHLAYIIERLKLPRSDLPNVLAENFSTLLCFFSWDNRIGEPRPDMSKILLEKFSQSGIVIEDGMTVGD